MEGFKYLFLCLCVFSTLACTSNIKRTPASERTLESDFLSPPGDFKANHSATIAELPGKKIIACWYAGSKEGAEDVEIYCRTQNLGTNNWSERITAVAMNEKTDGNFFRNDTLGNPVLYFDDDQTLYLFYGVRTFGGWSVAEVAYKYSTDFGKTWSMGSVFETREERRFAGRLPRALPFKIKAGKILLPLYYDLNPRAGFTCELDLSKGILTKNQCIDMPGKGHLQPSLVKKGSKILAYMRSKENHKIETAEMDISKYSLNSKWEQLPHLDLANPDSSVAAASTKDEKILLVYNGESGRNTLNLGISSDGRNFKEVFSFEKNTQPNDEFSYPTLFKDSNGNFHLLYTYHTRDAIKHVIFNESMEEIN